MGRGIGYVDLNLLASVALDETALLWSLDRRLPPTWVWPMTHRGGVLLAQRRV